MLEQKRKKTKKGKILAINISIRKKNKAVYMYPSCDILVFNLKKEINHRMKFTSYYLCCS